MALSMEIRRPSPATAVIDITGEITSAAEGQLSEAYEKASAEATKAVVLNFSGLEYMNSSGIGLLVTMLVRARRAKQTLLAFGLTDHYHEIFKLTRLDEAIAIHATEDAALIAAR